MSDDLSRGLSRFLEGLASTDRDRALELLRACPTIDLDPGVPAFAPAFPPDALLLVGAGFVVVRATDSSAERSVITCEAGAGTLLLPPSPEQMLVGLGRARLTVIDAASREELLRIPALAGRIVGLLASALGKRQEATASFAPTRHVDRVERKLLQLAGSYGHVVRDGIRIEFPVSHALLAEMIGSSRETVTRALDELQRTGFVARNGSTYRLLRDRRHVE